MHLQALVLIRRRYHARHLGVTIQELTLGDIVALVVRFQSINRLHWAQIGLGLTDSFDTIVIVVAACDLWIKRLDKHAARVASFLSPVALVDEEDLPRVFVSPHHAGPERPDVVLVWAFIVGRLLFPETPLALGRRLRAARVHTKSYFYFSTYAVI